MENLHETETTKTLTAIAQKAGLTDLEVQVGSVDGKLQYVLFRDGFAIYKSGTMNGIQLKIEKLKIIHEQEKGKF